MKVTILNGNPSYENDSFDNYLNVLSDRLISQSHEVALFDIKAKDIKPCTGCWTCWLKTPGLCAHKDDAHDMRREYIHSDFVLYATPIVMGFTSALLKKVLEKLIPLYHPYVEIFNGESGHRKRYDSYPSIGILLQRLDDTDEEDVKIVADYLERTVYQFHSRHIFTKLIDNPVEEVQDAINNL